MKQEVKSTQNLSFHGILYTKSPYDNIWGIGMSENDKDLFHTELWGENLLGKLLNKLYDEIQGKNQTLKSE